MAADASITDEELAELIRRTEEASSAYMRGDMDRYLELTHHVRGYTLINPLGGPPNLYDDRAESVRASADYFKGGEATLEVTKAHVWGDTVVLVMIEWQHGQVGGLPDQDWPLRVTQVHRRDDSGWVLVHRHADPLVHPIDLEQMGALARGGEEISAPGPRTCRVELLLCEASREASSFLSQHSQQAEVREGAAVGEPCDGGDLVVLKGEDDQCVRPRDVSLRARQIAGEGGLAIRARWHQS